MTPSTSASSPLSPSAEAPALRHFPPRPALVIVSQFPLRLERLFARFGANLPALAASVVHAAMVLDNITLATLAAERG